MFKKSAQTSIAMETPVPRREREVAASEGPGRKQGSAASRTAGGRQDGGLGLIPRSRGASPWWEADPAWRQKFPTTQNDSAAGRGFK